MNYTKLIIIEIDSGMLLLSIGKPKSKGIGSITFHLEAASLGVATRCSIQNLSRVILQKSDGSSNLSQFIGDVAPDIKNILELVDDIAQVILLNYTQCTRDF